MLMRLSLAYLYVDDGGDEGDDVCDGVCSAEATSHTVHRCITYNNCGGEGGSEHTQTHTRSEGACDKAWNDDCHV